jgi:hypothetical protein
MKCKSKDGSLMLTIDGGERLTIASLEAINKRSVIDHAHLYCRQHPGKFPNRRYPFPPLRHKPRTRYNQSFRKATTT